MREWVIVVSGGVSLEDQVVNHPQRPDQMVYDMLPAALREQAAYGERPSPAPGPDLSVAVEEGQARRVASGTLVSQSDPARPLTAQAVAANDRWPSSSPNRNA